jgi:hypothetical protein
LSWTTPSDLREQVKKLWERGDLLASVVQVGPAQKSVGQVACETGDLLPMVGETSASPFVFPRRLNLKCPNATELRDRFDEARSWSKKLREMPHVRVEWREFNHRTLGANSLPESAWLDSVEAAAALLAKQKDLRVLRSLLDETRAAEPALVAWVGRRPLKALSLAANWSRLLRVVAWMKANPNPRVYLRQIDVPEVHSKFIEEQRAVLFEMIDLVAPVCIVDSAATGLSGFARRYGLREKPERVRFRVLDEALHLLPGVASQDIELDAASFARLVSGVSRVFITENEVNFLAFPQVPKGLVIFGAGYGFSALREASWLHQCEMYYWGDIDTHGFAILNELRARFPQVKSLLMDRATLMQFRSLWGQESSPVKADLSYLSRDEAHLYDDLRDNVLGEAVRFEQERVSYSWVLAALGVFLIQLDRKHEP